MSWIAIVAFIALIVVAFELLLRGPSIFAIDDPRTLGDSLRLLVARGKHSAVLTIEVRSPQTHLTVQKTVAYKGRMTFTISVSDTAASTTSESAGRQVYEAAHCETPCPYPESEVDRVVSCLRLALDDAYLRSGGILPIRGVGSLSGILAFNVSRATGIVHSASDHSGGE